MWEGAVHSGGFPLGQVLPAEGLSGWGHCRGKGPRPGRGAAISVLGTETNSASWTQGPVSSLHTCQGWIGCPADEASLHTSILGECNWCKQVCKEALRTLRGLCVLGWRTLCPWADSLHGGPGLIGLSWLEEFTAQEVLSCILDARLWWWVASAGDRVILATEGGTQTCGSIPH